MTIAKGPDDPLAFPGIAAPLENAGTILAWLERMLLPRALGGGGLRAHQFTINGLTYPFVRQYNFAAVPDPFKNRQYDMYTGLCIPREGDLVFFFQADPQLPRSPVASRRGFRGIYQVRGTPYRASEPVVDTEPGSGYQVLDGCPGCKTWHGAFSATCPSCSFEFPGVRIGSQTVPARVLSARLDLDPLLVFERAISDERVYADLSDPGLVWVGRHDNAMGRGKGSSIRHLLPEEALKLARLFFKEPEQAIEAARSGRGARGRALAHESGELIDKVPVSANGQVVREDEL